MLHRSMNMPCFPGLAQTRAVSDATTCLPHTGLKNMPVTEPAPPIVETSTKPEAAAAFPELNPVVYARYMRAARALFGKLGVRMRVGGNRQHLHDGDIFLFNHFTRFETLYPPPLLLHETGAVARSVAHHGLFNVTPALTRFLNDTGVLPNNAEGLLPYLAAEILRGRKVVIFPEGGLVKDKRVFGNRGEWGVYSGSTGTFRKHHRGAAALALMLDVFKYAINDAASRGDEAMVEKWATELGLGEGSMGRKALLETCAKPTRIVPSTITFFPIRTGPNLLTKALETFGAPLNDQARDEIAIESNLMFKKTDMDLHIGEPLMTGFDPSRGHALLIRHAFGHVRHLGELFALRQDGTNWLSRVLQQMLDKQTDKMRDRYMRALYAGLTVNMNHLVAVLVQHLHAENRLSLPADVFHRTIYLAVKRLQNQKGSNLHCSLTRPAQYAGLQEGKAKTFKGFMKALTAAKLIKLKYTPDGPAYVLSHRLEDVQGQHEIRSENPVAMHANEAAPLPLVRLAVLAALKDVESLAPHALDAAMAAHLWDDEIRMFKLARSNFSDALLAQGPSDPEAGRPYLLLPVKKPVGATLLIHGLGGTPGQMRPLAEQLLAKGHAVLAMRLPGHGSAPHDMYGYKVADWMDSAGRNLSILRGHVAPETPLHVVGYSTGALVAMALAQTHPEIVRIAALAPALQLVNRLRHLLRPALCVNRLVGSAFGWLVPPLRHGLIPWFRLQAGPENSYRHIPLPSIRQLEKLAGYVRGGMAPSAALLLVHGTADATTSAAATSELFTRWNTGTLKLLDGVAHGLFDPGNEAVLEDVIEFIHAKKQ